MDKLQGEASLFAKKSRKTPAERRLDICCFLYPFPGCGVNTHIIPTTKSCLGSVHIAEIMSPDKHIKSGNYPQH